MALTVLDAGVLIAVLDASDGHHEAASAALRRELAAGSSLVVPASAYEECLVAPSRRGADAVCVVDEFLDGLPASIEPITRRIAAAAADLRARYGGSGRGRGGLRLPDALVVATGLVLEVDLILTTDRRWPVGAAPIEVVGGHAGHPDGG